MVKKLVAAGAVAGLLLSTVAPVVGFDGGDTIIKNKAKVKVITMTKADSGGNVISAGDDVVGGKIKTDGALAYGEVNSMVNSNDVDNCGCGFTLIKNKAKVKVITTTQADSGGNVISAGDDVEGGKIKTGYAEAGSVVTTVVNTNVVNDGI